MRNNLQHIHCGEALSVNSSTHRRNKSRYSIPLERMGGESA
jgi:hypothetical protein